ncbi:MAG: hypothetical protein K2Y32_13880 [Candidatus Obscuribacterales bacterium]|nr:hypothetical protein [Candidatus Obscuribacterales bacterium]
MTPVLLEKSKETARRVSTDDFESFFDEGQSFSLRRSPQRRTRFSASDCFKTGLLASLLILGAVFAFTAYETVSGFNTTDSRVVLEKARSYVARGEEESAVNLLSRTLEENSSRNFKGRDEIKALLDQCLYSHGLKLEQSGHFRDAVTAFSRISPAFARYDEVKRLITDNSNKALPREFSQVIMQTVDVDSSLPTGLAPSELIQEHAGFSKLDKAVNTVLPQKKAQETKPHDKGTFNHAAAAPLPGQLANSRDLAETEVVANQAASRLGKIARYNELLSAYFKRGSENTAEPPTYEEWLEGGMKEF